jgi:hypothetical protein
MLLGQTRGRERRVKFVGFMRALRKEVIKVCKRAKRLLTSADLL